MIIELKFPRRDKIILFILLLMAVLVLLSVTIGPSFKLNMQQGLSPEQQTKIFKKINMPLKTLELHQINAPAGPVIQLGALRFSSPFGVPTIQDAGGLSHVSLVFGNDKGMNIFIVPDDINNDNYKNLGFEFKSYFEYFKKLYSLNYNDAYAGDFQTRRSNRILLNVKAEMPFCDAIYCFENAACRGFVHEIQGFYVVQVYIQDYIYRFTSDCFKNTQDIVSLLSTVEPMKPDGQ
jgi:hypothetical protein